MPLSRREQQQYDELRRKRRQGVSREKAGAAPRSRRPEPDDEDGEDGVYVFSGRHADNLLNRMFGSPATQPEPDDDDEDDDDEDDDDEDDDPGDPGPPPGNRFFRRSQ